MRDTGYSPTLAMQQPDGTWNDISSYVSSVDMSNNLTHDYQRQLTREFSFSVQIRWINRSQDFLINLYRLLTHSKCPGSWKTKRLKKKRIKAINKAFVIS